MVVLYGQETILHPCRLAYPEWLLQEVIHTYQDEVKVYVMYDIACTLKKHLEVCIYIYDTICMEEFTLILFQRIGSTEILNRVQFALPTFHSYGHKPECQVCQ